MRTVAMTTAMILKSMLPPMEREISSAARERSGGARLGNFDGVAIDRGDVEYFAGLAGGVARNLRVPERVAVLHPRVARTFVDPGFEGRWLADVQPLHGADDGPFPVLMHPDDAGDRDGRGGERLPHERSARVRHARARERGDAEHEQVERAGGEFGDDENEAGDQPGERNVHGTGRPCCDAYATSLAGTLGLCTASSRLSRPQPLQRQSGHHAAQGLAPRFLHPGFAERGSDLRIDFTETAYAFFRNLDQRAPDRFSRASIDYEPGNFIHVESDKYVSLGFRKGVPRPPGSDGTSVTTDYDPAAAVYRHTAEYRRNHLGQG